MRIWPNYILILVGTFFQGFAAGVIVSAAPKIVEETVPFHVNDKGFGASTNLIINFAIMINMLLGFGLPAAGSETLKTTQFWRIIMGDAIPFSILSIVLLMTVHREDSLMWHVSKGE